MRRALNWLRKFMCGRYGADQFSTCLMAVYVALAVLSLFPPLAFLGWLTLPLAVYTLFRMLSKNIARRSAENARFLELTDPLRRWFRLRRTISRDKEHRYFKCPNCGQQLRVPRGKGKITVTCRSCGVSFEEKS